MGVRYVRRPRTTQSRKRNSLSIMPPAPMVYEYPNFRSFDGWTQMDDVTWFRRRRVYRMGNSLNRHMFLARVEDDNHE